jgi:hypothetical protein
MFLSTYILGSYYIVRTIFKISENITNHLFSKNYLNLPITKYEKINESIYSSFHSVIVSTTAAMSFSGSLFKYEKIEERDNEMQYLTASICFSYFVIDLVKCLYHKKYLFIIHHLASIYLLLITFYSFLKKDNKGFYAMYLIFLLESNTLLLNIGYLLKELKFHYSITCTVWIIHLLCFFLFRLVTIPQIIVMYYYFEEINFSGLMLLPAFTLILSGSVYWCYRQAIGINKYLRENCVI